MEIINQVFVSGPTCTFNERKLATEVTKINLNLLGDKEPIVQQQLTRKFYKTYPNNINTIWDFVKIQMECITNSKVLLAENKMQNKNTQNKIL